MTCGAMTSSVSQVLCPSFTSGISWAHGGDGRKAASPPTSTEEPDQCDGISNQAMAVGTCTYHKGVIE